ncbi:uncharacterized protein [Chironomus tepperi]|uniref:uncharacterized protein n=1 Tax=Chironomus tepperi TaxID=113505 RepID=UPI00391FA6E2
MRFNFVISIAALFVAINFNEASEIIEKFEDDQQETPSLIRSINLKTTDGTIDMIYPTDAVVKINEELPDHIVSEQLDLDKIWGNVTHTDLKFIQEIEYIRLPDRIAALNFTITFHPTIIHGIHLRSLNNTGAIGDIISGGVGYNFAEFRLVGRTNHMIFLILYYTDPTAETLPPLTTSTTTTTTITTTTPSTTSTTPIPDYYVLHWGNIHSGSELLSNNRHYEYPTSMTMPDRRITEYTQKTINGMRLYALNGTRGSFALIEGGLGYNFVKFRFVGESIGLAFDFRLELYNSAVSKSLSGFLVLCLSFLYLFMK